jgi:DNA-binding LytR/AlgR family response regulator
MNFKCIVIEDEPKAHEVLNYYIDQVPYLERVGNFVNAFEAIKWLAENDTDLIFLDIQMPQLNGIEFLQSIETKAKVIFTTAYDNYAVQGFEIGAIDYLMKPFSFARFMKAVSRASNKEQTPIEEAPLEVAKHLFFKTERSKVTKVAIDDILYIEAFGNYIKIFLTDSKLMVLVTLNNILVQLPSNIFMRIHKSYIVNISKVKNYDANSITINTIELPIGRVYKMAVRERFM